MPLFRFQLATNPVIRRENGALMHWFGLTDGRYWIDTGEREIFRTADGEYLDYYVVRLWEDVLEMLPDVLEPLPASIHARLRDMPRWLEFHARAWSWREEGPHRGALATDWFDDRHLDTLHLRNPPSVWFWREHDEIVLSWKTRAPRHAEDPAWSAGDGRIRVGVDRFLGDFLSFHAALMKDMDALVARLGREHGAEADALRQDHERRKAAVTTRDALLAQATKTDWRAVEEALARLEAELG